MFWSDGGISLPPCGLDSRLTGEECRGGTSSRRGIGTSIRVDELDSNRRRFSFKRSNLSLCFRHPQSPSSEGPRLNSDLSSGTKPLKGIRLRNVFSVLIKESLHRQESYGEVVLVVNGVFLFCKINKCDVSPVSPEHV